MPDNTTEKLDLLARQFESMLRTAAADPQSSAPQLRQILRFMARVVQVVEQAFDSLQMSLIELKYLSPAEFDESRRLELLKQLESLGSREHMRQVEIVCGRLHALMNDYHDHIAPALSSLTAPTQEVWLNTSQLLDQHEGLIINLFGQAIWDLTQMVQNAQTEADLKAIREFAAKRSAETRAAVDRLHALNTALLGHSGSAGLIELTETLTPDQLRANVNVVIDQSIRVGNVSGTGIAVGHGASAGG